MTGLNPQRPRLLLILGAGSAIHAGAPSTKQITDLVRQIEEEPIRLVITRLREQRSEGNFNFETVLAALEELDEFQVRRRLPTAWQRIAGHLSAFAELLPELSDAEDHSFLIARTRLVGRIKNFVIEQTANASAAALQAFFDRLKAAFDLTVLTLNYDDLIDQRGTGTTGSACPRRRTIAENSTSRDSPLSQLPIPPYCCICTEASVLTSLPGSLDTGAKSCATLQPEWGWAARCNRHRELLNRRQSSRARERIDG